MMLKLGDTFLAPWPSVAEMHLQIVISNPDPDGKVLAVSVCTLRKGMIYDCEIKADPRHNFIAVDSCINFKLTRLIDPATINPPHFKSKDPIASDIVAMIHSYAQTTLRLKDDYRAILESQGFISD